MANFCKPFTRAKVKYFDRSEVDAAWNWLEKNDESPNQTKATDGNPDVPDQPDAWDNFRWYGP
jgi:hypothetical protein